MPPGKNISSIEVKGAEAGFALPSVLFLITILGIVAASLLSLGYLRKKVVLTDIARLRAAYAAESGIAYLTRTLRSDQVLGYSLWDSVYSYAFDSGRSTSNVSVKPWGMFYWVESTGEAHGIKKTRSALLGERPDGGLNDAMRFGHQSHQLVLTGDIQIKGNLTTGRSGVTIGTLQDYSTPLHLPVDGAIRTVEGYTIPEMKSPPLARHLSIVAETLLDTLRARSGLVVLHAGGGMSVSTDLIGDSLKGMIIDGDALLEGEYPDRSEQCSISIRGTLVIRPSARIRGSYLISATGPITIATGAKLEDIVLTSYSKIEIERGSSGSLQCFAPRINLREDAHLRYPSILYGIDPTGLDTASLCVNVEKGSQVEGLIALSTRRDGDLGENLIRIDPKARVTGVVFSEARIQCDGEITGSIITNDLYFYAEPTTYLGWLRQGVIDRVNLPSWYALPSGLDTDHNITVIRWI